MPEMEVNLTFKVKVTFPENVAPEKVLDSLVLTNAQGNAFTIRLDYLGSEMVSGEPGSLDLLPSLITPGMMGHCKARLNHAIAAVNQLMIDDHDELPPILAKVLSEADINLNGIRDALYPEACDERGPYFRELQ